MIGLPRRLACARSDLASSLGRFLAVGGVSVSSFPQFWYALGNVETCEGGRLVSDRAAVCKTSADGGRLYPASTIHRVEEFGENWCTLESLSGFEDMEC